MPNNGAFAGTAKGQGVQRPGFLLRGDLSVSTHPVALAAADAPARKTRSNYPENFVSRLGDRLKRPLGDPFGLTIFGVNLTTLPSGAMSALRHAPTRPDQFISIFAG